ncbi:putative nuclease HARBI1 [Camellia sinensis]|uniref:putative nuclease HARBI1 n=1 Tax=Camellia sinensis TaxID=4442 RepID=UPI001035D6C7|nr:putative nuclease HARBI1 [Camellia sinensis]
MDPAKGKGHKRGPATSQTDSGRSKKSRSSGFDNVCAAFTSYVQVKIGHSRTRENETEAVSAGGDDYSLDACQDALLELGDLPPLQYIRALTLFKDKEWRRQRHMSSDRENNTMELSSDEDEDCVGAIDGTLVDAWVPTSRQNTFRGRKATVSQNVLAACDFDMLFTFINSGWEGSAHDNAILLDSITRVGLQFPHPPNGKYYLVDAGFTNMPGFLAPFRSQRCHLQEFHGHRYVGPKELFNHQHSSLRNVIERTFGVLKKRFPILRSMPNYKSTRQGSIVIACCVVHNWIRLHAAMDPFFMEADNEMAAEAEAEADGLVGDQADYVDMSQHGLTSQSNVRDAIATAMWQNHVHHA